MPELPEVTVIINTLKPIMLGKRIDKVDIFREKNVLSDVNEFKEKIEGSSVIDIERKGKYLIFSLNNGYAFECHLRMEGKFYLREENEKNDKHDILDFVFSDHTRLSYNDVRKFGGFYLEKKENLFLNSPLKDLGKEPFDINGKEFYELIKKDNRPIKEILLDQKVIAGIGNIYDSEILFSSKIHPLEKGKDLSLNDCDNLIRDSVRILGEAIELGGSTIHSFHPSKGVDGRMQSRLLVYGKEGEKCPNCLTPIRRIFVSGRSSFYCPVCQKRKDNTFIVGVVGPIASGKSTVSLYLEEKGYIHLDADKMVWEAYKEKEVMECLINILSPEIIKDGKIDRKAFSLALLKDENKRKDVENYIHSLVIGRMKRTIEENKGKKILLDVPLLINGPLEDLCDVLIYIEADERIRRERIALRGKDPDLALKLNSSFPKKKAISRAQIKLSGNGTNSDLVRQLKEIKYL